MSLREKMRRFDEICLGDVEIGGSTERARAWLCAHVRESREEPCIPGALLKVSRGLKSSQKAAMKLVLEGKKAPNGYTELLDLHIFHPFSSFLIRVESC